MYLINPFSYSKWILVLTVLQCGTAQSEEAYPNPFAKPAQLAPAPAQQPLGSPAANPPPDAYPNPFAPKPAGSPSGTQGSSAAGSATGSSGAYPNPFGPGTQTPGTGTGDTPPIAPNPASPDPQNAGGTCCCDSRKTFQTSAFPQPAGGCCATGNKWGCSCQDGGSFLHNPLACPVLHRNTRVTPSGPRFELFCNVQTHRTDIKVDSQASFLECVDACGALAGCVGVDFDKVNKQCHYKSEYMDENTDGAANNDMDSASMPPLTCPQAQDQLKTISGVEYKIFCNNPTTSFAHKQYGDYATAEACGEFCSSQPACQGYDYRPTDKQCWTTPDYQNPPQGQGANFITFVPTKKK